MQLQSTPRHGRVQTALEHFRREEAKSLRRLLASLPRRERERIVREGRDRAEAQRGRRGKLAVERRRRRRFGLRRVSEWPR